MPPAIPADSLRSALDSVFAGPAYRWIESPHPFAFLRRWWDQLELWLARFRESNPALFFWFFWGMIAVLVLIFLHAAWVMYQTVRAASAPADQAVAGPRAERRDAGWYRRRAERLASEGRFMEAIQADFHSLVLELDGRGLVRFQPSKTPGEYAREAGVPEAERDRLREMVQSLYGYVFARVLCGPAEYRAWREHTAKGWHAAAH